LVLSSTFKALFMSHKTKPAQGWLNNLLIIMVGDTGIEPVTPAV
jgi:hypothetical protein